MSVIKKIAQVYLSGKLSCTIIIPIEIARKQGIDKPSVVSVEELNGGIFIKKLEIAK
jgi:hypothetical protein